MVSILFNTEYSAEKEADKVVLLWKALDDVEKSLQAVVTPGPGAMAMYVAPTTISPARPGGNPGTKKCKFCKGSHPDIVAGKAWLEYTGAGLPIEGVKVPLCVHGDLLAAELDQTNIE